MTDEAQHSDADRPEDTTPVRPLKTTFIVRMSENETGAVAGVVEQPSTGRKERFQGIATIGDVIAGMLGAGTDHRAAKGEQP